MKNRYDMFYLRSGTIRIPSGETYQFDFQNCLFLFHSIGFYSKLPYNDLRSKLVENN